MATNLFGALVISEMVGKNFVFGTVTICAVCALMLIANMLRRQIPFLRRSFMPTAVIAGFLGLLIKEVVFAITDFNIFSEGVLQGVVYHLLPIGFIALCLREKDDYAKEYDKKSAKKEKVNAFKSGSLIVSTYMVQGIVGVLATIVIGCTFIPQLNNAIGIILPLGFGQGPQQASATGMSWDLQGLFSWTGYDNAGQNFGISVAAFGFLWAAIPGVIMINRIAKKRGIQLHKNEYQKSGNTLSTQIEGPDEVPLSESIDKFSLQLCMVGGVYLITLGVLVLLDFLLNLTGVGFLVNLVSTIWGFGWMVAVLMALIAKLIMRKLFRKGIMKRKYPNSYMMNRISGAAFDLSVTASLCVLSVTQLGILWVPLIIISTLGGVVSIFFIRFLANRVYPAYKDEAFLAMYGMLTGTISNGMILLRELDPTFKTHASDDLVSGSTAGIVLGFPLLLLIGMATQGNNIWWVLAIMFVYMCALVFYQIFDFKTKKFIRPVKAAVLADGEKERTDEIGNDNTADNNNDVLNDTTDTNASPDSIVNNTDGTNNDT